MSTIETTVRTYHQCRLLEEETEKMLRKKKLPKRDRQLLLKAHKDLHEFNASIEALPSYEHDQAAV